VYGIGTWRRYVQWSKIKNHGTVQNKAILPYVAARTQEDKRRQAFTIIGDAWLDRRIMKKKVVLGVQFQQIIEREAVAEAFEHAFGGG
jgi:hypothetical protein